jgi:hypothetical protein
MLPTSEESLQLHKVVVAVDEGLSIARPSVDEMCD